MIIRYVEQRHIRIGSHPPASCSGHGRCANWKTFRGRVSRVVSVHCGGGETEVKAARDALETRFTTTGQNRGPAGADLARQLQVAK